jgi:hypothetical protein
MSSRLSAKRAGRLDAGHACRLVDAETLGIFFIDLDGLVSQLFMISGFLTSSESHWPVMDTPRSRSRSQCSFHSLDKYSKFVSTTDRCRGWWLRGSSSSRVFSVSSARADDFGEIAELLGLEDDLAARIGADRAHDMLACGIKIAFVFS